MSMMLLSILDIVALIAGLAIYLFIVGGQLTRIASDLEECSDLVREIAADAEPILPALEHINRTGGVVAGALPLLYGMAEGIVTGVTPRTPEPAKTLSSTPNPGARRNRLAEGVGYVPAG